MIYGEENPFPPDIRLEKEIKALCDAGHRVTVLTQRIPDNALNQETLIEGCASINRIIIKKKGFLLRQLWHFTLLHRSWIPVIREFIEKEKPEILHVHDFDLVPTTIKVAQRCNLPVIADLHENMPAAHRAYRSTKPISYKLINAALFNYHIWRRKESRILKICAKIIVVVPEAAERLLKYGITEEKIAIVSNTEDETTFPMPTVIVDKDIEKKYSRSWIALYVGGIGPHRGIDTVIQALPIVIKVIPGFRLVVVGARNSERKLLNDMAREYDVSPFVEIIDWLPVEKIKNYILCSKVCLVPHNDFEHTQTTVPHKLFQYMICKKPVLVSSCRPLVRIVKKTNAGKIFEANDSSDFAKKLIDMYKDPDMLDEIGLNGYKAATGPFAWRNDAKRLAQIYYELQN
jgi:glycosyltransferase involved in cell wall biosynthesis